MKEFVADKAKWQFETVVEEYCSWKKKNRDELSEEEINEIWYFAGMHILYFLTWIIKKDFLDDEEYSDCKEMLEGIKKDKIPSSEFLELIDYTITRDDLKDEIKDFIDNYYENGKYFDDYFKIVNTENNWFIPLKLDRYYKLEKKINERYSEFIK